MVSQINQVNSSYFVNLHKGTSTRNLTNALLFLLSISLCRSLHHARNHILVTQLLFLLLLLLLNRRCCCCGVNFGSGDRGSGKGSQLGRGVAVAEAAAGAAARPRRQAGAEGRVAAVCSGEPRWPKRLCDAN